jgi:2-methylaconitate cis-trans-isomerase PrpF
MRGGTSKAVFLMEEDLPRDVAARDALILRLFGSPDKRQIDGLGGADPLTSKCAVIGRSTRSDADVTFAFYQVGVDHAIVKPSICGNISAAVGPFAIDEGIVAAREPVTTVAIYNPHTDRVFYAEVPVERGKAKTRGDFEIAGVPGRGARIVLDWRNVIGIETGALLPTGNRKDVLAVPGRGEFEVSIVDGGNPAVFVPAAALDLAGTELPDAVNAHADLLRFAEDIRSAAAERVGLVSDRRRAAIDSPNHPFLVLVAAPASYLAYDGRCIEASAIDVTARAFFMQTLHKTFPGTGALCTGIAARIPGTVVHDFARAPALRSGAVEIGHPGGTMNVEVDVAVDGGEFVVRRAAVARTARRIMEGYACVE